MLLTIVIADPQRVTAIRDGLPTPGRVLRYATSNLASALESIRANQPGLIILDSVFLHTEAGHGFVQRINNLNIAKLVLQQTAFDHGHWTMTPIDQAPPTQRPPDSQRVVAVKQAGLDTRRAPRFRVQDVPQAVVDGTPINVVDLSVLGAQMISTPMMRPNQKIKVNLPDSNGGIQLTANVAWSVYEKRPNDPAPHFRVGVEFSNAEQAILEDYCKRHCSPVPLPVRH
jgi:hypothetical protein